MLNPKLKIHCFGKTINSFQFFAMLGFLVCCLLTAFLCYRLNIPIYLLVSFLIVDALIFFALVFLTKLISGKEIIVYYHHEIIIMAANAIVFIMMDLPILLYLDITILAIATCMSIGRIGCFSVGCCHGRPAKRGVVYGGEHVEAGFTPHYEGIALMPVQLFESAFVFIIIIIGSILTIQRVEPGTVLLLYTIIYGSFRFIIEFYRGDIDRPYWIGFSEAQWTTLILFCISAFLSYIAWLPFYAWHIGLVIALIVFMTGMMIYRKQQLIPVHKITHPKHVEQIAKGILAVEELVIDKQAPGEVLIPIFETYLGFNISYGKQNSMNGLRTFHYTLSKSGYKEEANRRSKIHPKMATLIGKLIHKIKHPEAKMETKKGQKDIYHIVFTEKTANLNPIF